VTNGLAEVIATTLMAHLSATYEPDADGAGQSGIWCDNCDDGQLEPGVSEDEWLAKHQAEQVAEELAKAGYGDKEAVWDEGHGIGRRQEAAEARGFRTTFTNPYRRNQP
jgi:hypothetical protein